jgi:hypothetical protein
LKICTNVNGKRKQDLVISLIIRGNSFHEIEDKNYLIYFDAFGYQPAELWSTAIFKMYDALTLMVS